MTVRVLLAALTVLVLAACAEAPTESTVGPTGSGATPSGNAAGSSPDASAVAKAKAVLKAADLGEPATISALEGTRFTAAGTEAARSLLEEGAADDLLWAATYVYASAGADPGPLVAVAGNTAASHSVRAMAGAGLISAGNVAGFDPLIAALVATEPMDGADPAGFTWEFAADVLARYTDAGFGPTLDATDDERASIGAEWQAWLAANHERLRFDSATQRWVVA